jgi:hypothetical protein
MEVYIVTLLFDERKIPLKEISITLALILGLFIFSTIAEASKRKPAKVDLTYYFDNRDYNTLNIQTSLPDLPWGFKIWGFIDIQSEQKNADQRFDLTRYFMEYRLKRSIFSNSTSAWKGLGFEIEYNDANGTDNAVVRPGLTYKHEVPFIHGNKSWFEWRYHPYETDGSGSQVSLIYRLHLAERIFISGFVDLNLENDTDNRWVLEPQINFKINETFDLVLETRYNENEDVNNALDGFGIAGGLKIKF